MAEQIDTNSFKNGTHIEIDGQVWKIVWFQHHKPGKGGAVMRTKLKNVASGAVVERTFRAGEKFPRIHTETRNAQYLYADGDGFVFMDPETFDQSTLDAKAIGDAAKYLQEGDTVQLLLLDGQPSDVQLPTTVELEITETEPAVKGDTVSNVTKSAVVETGAVLQVPMFVNVGDKVKIDTRDGSYLGRV